MTSLTIVLRPVFGLLTCFAPYLQFLPSKSYKKKQFNSDQVDFRDCGFPNATLLRLTENALLKAARSVSQILQNANKVSAFF